LAGAGVRPDLKNWPDQKSGITFGRGAPRGNPSARTQLFAADRRTSHGSKKEETLRCSMEVPEETERSII